MILFLAACTPPERLPADVLEGARTVAGAVDGDRLMADVRALVAEHETEEPVVLGGIWEDLPHRHDAAGAWLGATFEARGFAPVFHDVDRHGIASHTVIVDLPGASDEVVLLSAHHDVWFTAANDNSAGVAVLLEVARLLADRPLKRTVRLVSFDQEEPGLYGSRRYYEDHDWSRIVAALNVDTLAYTSATQDQPAGFDLPDEGDFVSVLGNGPGSELASTVAQVAAALDDPVPVVIAVAAGHTDWPATGGFDTSDHAAAWDRGIPGLFFSDTAFWRNPHYHTESDLPDTLDPVFFRRAAALVAATTWAAAEAP